ncbi:MAG: hypothetical protein P8Z37_18835 [Acidobacteriota bacterium]
MIPSAKAQLRTFSEYDQDRINTERTCFVLHDNGEAEYIWVSEWNHRTAYAADGKSAIVIWHFKDGTTAYSQQGEGVGEFGKTTGYLISDTARTLEDAYRNHIQPLSLDNYPVKIELWIGDIEDATGYDPEVKGDEACLIESNIEYNVPYHFSSCPAEENEKEQPPEG